MEFGYLWGIPKFFNKGGTSYVFSAERLDQSNEKVALIISKKDKLSLINKSRKFDHPNIVKIYRTFDATVDIENFKIEEQELLSYSLKDAKDCQSIFSKNEVWLFLNQIFSALIFLKEKNLYHPDIKIHNIALSLDLKNVKLIDIGDLEKSYLENYRILLNEKERPHAYTPKYYNETKLYTKRGGILIKDFTAYTKELVVLAAIEMMGVVQGKISNFKKKTKEQRLEFLYRSIDKDFREISKFLVEDFETLTMEQIFEQTSKEVEKQGETKGFHNLISKMKLEYLDENKKNMMKAKDIDIENIQKKFKNFRVKENIKKDLSQLNKDADLCGMSPPTEM